MFRDKEGKKVFQSSDYCQRSSLFSVLRKRVCFHSSSSFCLHSFFFSSFLFPFNSIRLLFFHSFLLTFHCFHRVLCSVVIYFVCMCYFLHLILVMHILGLVLSRLSECELDCVLCFFNGFPRLDRFAFFCRSPKTRFVLRDCRRQFWSTHERNRSSR